MIYTLLEKSIFENNTEKRFKVEVYNKHGYILIDRALDLSLCTELISRLDDIPSKINIPYTDLPWGYGNLLEDNVYKKVLQEKNILTPVRKILGNDFVFNHLVVNNKQSFIGSAVEWHQELSAINTFAPGYTDEDVDNFVQAYIALDDHTQDNRCLYIFPGSHKEGLLPHYDMLGYNLNHKKHILHSELVRLNEKTPVKKVSMKAGDVLIFSHLLVHGSGSNMSPFSRRAIVLQARKHTKEKDLQIFEKDTEQRIKFVVNALKTKLKEIQNKYFYKDFK
jgi:ectoine hydroxylase